MCREILTKRRHLVPKLPGPMPVLITLAQAGSLFTNHPTRQSVFDSMRATGCLVPVGKIHRVDVYKFHHAFPDLKIPDAWFEETKQLENPVSFRDLCARLPLDIQGTWVRTPGELRRMIWIGMWEKQDLPGNKQLYSWPQFEHPTRWRTEEGFKYLRMEMWMGSRNLPLAQGIAKLAKAWTEILDEQRLGVKRATLLISQAEFAKAMANVQEKLAAAPWKNKQVINLLKGFNDGHV